MKLHRADKSHCKFRYYINLRAHRKQEFLKVLDLFAPVRMPERKERAIYNSYKRNIVMSKGVMKYVSKTFEQVHEH